MTNYYIIRRSSDPAVLGIDNGIKQAEIHRPGFQDPARYADIMHYLGSNEFYKHRSAIPGMCFDLQCVRLLGKAKLTDFLQFGPALMNCPFLVSARAHDVLRRFSHPGIVFWPAKVVDAPGSHPYHLVYAESMPEEMIDIPRSTYSLGGIASGKTQHTFATLAEKTSFMASNRMLRQEHIALGATFPPEADWFVIGNTMLASERLKAALEEAGLTGVNFLPAYGENRSWETVGRHA